MKITLPRASFSLVVVLLIVCTVDSKGGEYLAFPQMGRSMPYPRRMGRSLNKLEMGRSLNKVVDDFDVRSSSRVINE